MRVCGELCDSRTDRIDDADDFPNLAGRGYRCQDAKEIIIMSCISLIHEANLLTPISASFRQTFLLRVPDARRTSSSQILPDTTFADYGSLVRVRRMK